jgi:hypothetical protein
VGELLGDELGTNGGYTGAALSEWERGRSPIHKDQRPVLTALVKILHECGGLQNVAETNALLLARNYRPLDDQEQERLFPEAVQPGAPAQPQEPGGGSQPVGRALGHLSQHLVRAARALPVGRKKCVTSCLKIRMGHLYSLTISSRARRLSSSSTRAAAIPISVRTYFDLGVNYVGAVVNVHQVELYILDGNGQIAAPITRTRWDSDMLLHERTRYCLSASSRARMR